MRPREIVGIVVGAVFDILMSGLVGGLIGVVLVVSMSAGHPAGSPSITPDAFKSAMEASFWVQASAFVVGGLMSAGAGYVAAWIARRNEMRNGALSSFLCVGQGIFILTAGHSTHSLPYLLLEILLPPVLGLAGGYLRLRKTRQAW